MPFLGRKAAVLGSLLLAAAAGIGAYMGLCQYDDIRLTATTVVALAGTLTGFLLTALSVLVSNAERPAAHNMRLTGHYPALIQQIFHTVLLWLSVIVVGLAGHVSTGNLQLVLVALSLALTVLSLIKLVVVGRRFSMVVGYLSKGA